MTVVQQRAPGESAALDVASLHKEHRRGVTSIYVAVLAVAVALTPLMMYANFQWGAGLAIGGLVAVALLVLTLRAPIVGFYVLTLAAVVIEENPLAHPIGTDNLYVFSWPVSLAGLPERPIGFYILFILLVIVAIRLAMRKGVALHGGPLFLPLLAFLACVVVGIAHGLTTGGQFRIIVLEIRPFWYLFTTYLVAYNLVSEKKHIITFLWILVLGTFFKALQGCYIVVTALHGQINSGVNEIMAHEQSYFFVLILLLIILCILMKRLRAMMWVAVASLPFLIIALIANNRRADYLAFVLGLATVWLLVIAVNVRRRKALIAGFIVSGVIAGAYIGVFGNINTPISAPANAIVSVFQPGAADIRDAQSNLYRQNEDADLLFTEKQSPLLGYGFGKPFLQPKLLPDIGGLDPYYLYIPHNNILWIWMRLGPIGFLAFWYVISAAIVRGGVMMKRLRDPDLQLIAMFIIGAIITEIPLAYGDYQLYFYRNIFITGLLMGILMRLPAIDALGKAANSGASYTEGASDTSDASDANGAAGAETFAGHRTPVAVAQAQAIAAITAAADAAERFSDDSQDERVGAWFATQSSAPASATRLREQYRAHMWDS